MEDHEEEIKNVKALMKSALRSRQGETAYSEDKNKTKEELLKSTYFPYSKEFISLFVRALAENANSALPEVAAVLHNLANRIEGRVKDKAPLYFRAMAILECYEDPKQFAEFSGEALNKATAELINDLIEEVFGSTKKLRSKDAKHAADIRHSKPGASRDKQEKVRLIWANGKYTSRDICAEQECAALNMSFSAARKALRNTPAPTKPNAGR